MKFFKLVRPWCVKNQSGLMLATGIGGLIATTILAVRGHTKANKIIDQDMRQHETDEYYAIYVDKKGTKHARKKYRIKKTWKYYVPAAVTGSLSVACLIASYKVNYTRNAALATSLAASQAAMNEYQKAVVDTVGEEVETGIRSKINENNVTKAIGSGKTESPNDLKLYLGETTKIVCYETTTYQRFLSTKEDIKAVVNKLNQERLNSYNGTITLNDLYYELGLKSTTIGDYIGWTTSEPVDISYTTAEIENIPCLCVQPINMVSLQ